jgi:HK97 family phage portal protein
MWPFKKSRTESAGLPAHISGGGYSDIGFTGTDSALENSAFWACLNNLCRTFAALPVHLYTEAGVSHDVVRSGAGAAVLKKPCAYMTSYQWRFVMAFNYEVFGVAYAILEKSSLGAVIAMYPVSPRLMLPQWIDGRLMYRYSPTAQLLDPHNVLAVHNTPVGFSSVLCPVEYARKDIEMSASSKSLQTNYYKRGTTIGSVLTVPRNTDKEVKKQLQAMFSNEFAGAANAYKNIIVEDGMKYEPIRLEEKDSAKMTEAQSWTLLEVCRRFGVPPFFAGDLTKATYANSEQQGTQLVQYAIQPRTKSWEDALDDKICRANEYVKFSLGGLMRGDHAARSAFYHNAILDGWMTVNEVRSLEDLNPVKDGDVLMFPMNYTSLANAVKAQPYSPSLGMEAAPRHQNKQFLGEKRIRDLAYLEETRNATSSYRAQIERIIRKQLKLEIAEIRRLIATNQGNGVQKVVDDFRAFCEKTAGAFSQEYTAVYQAMLQRLVPVVQKKVNTGDEVSSDAGDAYAATYAQGMAGRHGNARAGEMERALTGHQEDELEAVASDVAQNWVENVPVTESTDETNRAGNAFNLFLYSQLGVRFMHVVAAPDACEFCSRLDGQVCEVNGTVLAKGASMDDGQGNVRTIKKNMKHPPWHGHCACGIAPGR